MPTFSFFRRSTLRSAPMLRHAIAMAVVVALSGCAPRTSTPPSPVAPIPGDATPTESNFIHGRATYLERIKIPPGADFTVQLIDNQLADTQQAVIAETTLEDVAGPPYEFSMQYDPAKLRPNGQYGLSANLRASTVIFCSSPTRACRSCRATRR